MCLLNLLHADLIILTCNLLVLPQCETDWNKESESDFFELEADFLGDFIFGEPIARCFKMERSSGY